MIGQQDALRLFGRTVLDPMGRHVGIVGQLFLDARTEQPTWITVESGVFGTNVRVVPLDGADFDGTTLTVAVPRLTVRQAPRVALHQGDLLPEAEQVLHAHYERDRAQTECPARGTGSYGVEKARPDGSIARGLKGIIRKLVM